MTHSAKHSGGQKAPDCWFNETSTFIDIETGEDIECQEPLLAQRQPKIMALELN